MGTNVCIVEGRLTKDAEYTTFGQNATPKLSFSLANNTGYGDYKKVHYFNCEIIGKKADSLSQYMTQGKAVNLTGEIQQQRWEDADGNKKNKWLLHVINVSFTSGSKDSQESGEYKPTNTQGQSSNPAPASHQPSQQASSPPKDPFAAALAGAKPIEAAGKTNEWEDDIPF